jgi:hypothetical protein
MWAVEVFVFYPWTQALTKLPGLAITLYPYVYVCVCRFTALNPEP